jgi:hypothetical protein
VAVALARKVKPDASLCNDSQNTVPILLLIVTRNRFGPSKSMGSPQPAVSGSPTAKTSLASPRKPTEGIADVIQFPSPRCFVRKNRTLRAGRVREAETAPANLSITCRNSRLRDARKDAWLNANAKRSYWRERLDFESAVYYAQSRGIPEGQIHPKCDPQERNMIVATWRAALVDQLLTPAPDAASVKWKQAVLAKGDHQYTDVKSERIERAIADDLAFLAAHPVRRSNSEAWARRREFKEAMRQRIRDIAASRDLSDEEIEPVLKLKHHEIANFSEKHAVNVEWLPEGKGRIFESGPTP